MPVGKQFRLPARGRCVGQYDRVTTRMKGSKVPDHRRYRTVWGELTNARVTGDQQCVGVTTGDKGGTEHLSLARVH